MYRGKTEAPQRGQTNVEHFQWVTNLKKPYDQDKELLE